MFANRNIYIDRLNQYNYFSIFSFKIKAVRHIIRKMEQHMWYIKNAEFGGYSRLMFLNQNSVFEEIDSPLSSMIDLNISIGENIYQFVSNFLK